MQQTSKAQKQSKFAALLPLTSKIGVYKMHAVTTFHSVNKTPFVLTASAGLSDFQTEYTIKLSESPDFDSWCSKPMDHNARLGPTMFVYYTKDGRLHGDRVGVKRVIRCVVSN